MTPLALDALLASLHHLLAFPLVAVLAAELVLTRGPLDALRLRQLGRLDKAYGALAGGLLLAGGLRVVYGAKGWAYYAGQPFFWAKLGTFVLIGLLSVVPTLRLLAWRRRGVLPDAAALQGLRFWTHTQAALIVLLLVFAVLMARGIGV
jgi:putative membrane protein